jgi:hypothetical protein
VTHASNRTLGDDLIEESYAHFARNLDSIIIHLRDARNILVAVTDDSGTRSLAKSAILLASASVEANLASMSDLGVTLAEKHGGLAPIQIDYLRGVQEVIDDRGNPQTRPLRQSLESRLRTIPALLGHIFGIEFHFPDDAEGAEKLRRLVAYRDAIVHPRWQRYLFNIGWQEAALAVDAAEWYLEIVSTAMSPYLGYYKRLLHDMPNADETVSGPVGQRVREIKPSDQAFTTMAAAGFLNVATKEWLDSVFMTTFALGSQCEGDSHGSMLTRAALVILYSMLDGQLALNAQSHVYSEHSDFSQSEILFLTETAVEIDVDGAVLIDETHEQFKKRLIGIPRVLCRRVRGEDVSISLGDAMGEALIRYKDLRDAVMHSRVGAPLPRVTKAELSAAGDAVREYFKRLASACPYLFKFYEPLITLGIKK